MMKSLYLLEASRWCGERSAALQSWAHETQVRLVNCTRLAPLSTSRPLPGDESGEVVRSPPRARLGSTSGESLELTVIRYSVKEH
ncbi:hypothetical protein E2C01_011947 [Portunus trituberculatus]|uniref:Uncharacterized protein n=1 Tax=Portunus trituberculatus TaxID=210409 RepID=A0A5B7DCE4_PORTR|nr:hypothetical protein [Portunus trituberculatus]